jgi:hypothetical protein
MKWLKRAGIGLGVLVLVLVVVAAIVTRPRFITSVIVPRVGKAIQTDIRIGALEFAPFSRVQAGEVRVGPEDVPLLQGKLMRVRYRLLSALTGRIQVDEVTLEDTAIHVVKRADGSMNLPVFPPSTPRKHRKKDEDPTTAEAAKVHIADVRLSGLSFIYEQRAGPGQEPLLVKLSNLTLDVPEVVGGKEISLKLGGRVDEVAVGGVTGVGGTLDGQCRLELWPNLDLSTVDLVLRIAFNQGQANAVALAGRELRLEVQMAYEHGGYVIRRAAVSELTGDRPEAAVALSGRVQWQPAEVQLDVVAEPLEAAVFDIAGALLGDLSFAGAPSGTYQAKVALKSSRRLSPETAFDPAMRWTATLTGNLALHSLSPASAKYGLRDVAPFDASLEHDITWQAETGTIEVRRLAAHAGTPEHEMLSAELSQPLVLDLSGKTSVAAQAEGRLALKARGVALNLANPFIPRGVPLSLAAGALDADADISLAQQGAAIGVTGTVKVTDARLADQKGATGVPFAVDIRLGAKVAQMRRLEADALTVSLQAQGKPLAQLQASGRFDLDQGGEGTVALGGVQETLLAVLPASLGAALPLERFALDGEVQWQAGRGFQPLTTTAKLQVQRVRLHGQAGADELAAGLSLQTELQGDDLAVRSAALQASVGGQPVVQLAAQGALSLKQTAGPARTLTLSSELIDVDRCLAFAKPLLSPAAGRAAPAAANAPAPTAKPAAPTLPALNLTATLDFRKIVYNTRTVALTGAVALAEAAELKALVLQLPTGTVTLDGLLKPEGSDWRTRLSVAAAGEALTELAGWAGRPLPGDPLRGTTLRARLDGAMAPDASRVRLDAVDVRLSQADQSPMLRVDLAKPLTLALAKTGAITWTATDLTVSAAKFPLTMAAVALPADAGVHLDSGLLDASLAVALQEEALSAAVRGTFTIADLAGRRGEQAFSAIRVEGTVRGQATGKDHATLSELNATVAASGNRALTLAATAEWDRSQGSSATVDLSADVPVVLKAAALGGTAAAKLQSLNLAIKAKAQMAATDAPIHTTIELAATDIRLKDAAGQPLPPWTAQIAAAAVLQPDRVALESSTLRAQAGEKALANLTLAGTFATKAGRGDLKLTGDLLDLTGLLGVAQGDAVEEDAKQGKGKGPAKEPATEPGPFNTGATAVTAVVDLKNVLYGEIKSDVDCTVRLENSVLTIDPLKASVGGSPLSGNVKANLGVQGLDYAANLTFGALDFSPFLKTFAPDLAPAIQGSLTGLTVDLAGQGVTLPSLRKTLHGRFDTAARNVVVQGLPGQAELARKWAVPELERLQVAQLDLKTRVQGGQVLVDTCREVSPEHTLAVTGKVGLDSSLAVDLTVGVGGTLQTRLSQNSAGTVVMKYLTKDGDHLVTPAAIPIIGTLAAPKVDYERFLTRLATGSGTNLLKGLLEGKQGQSSDSALGELLKKGGLTLPGVAAPATQATPAAPATTPAAATGTAAATAKGTTPAAPAATQAETPAQTEAASPDAAGQAEAENEGDAGTTLRNLLPKAGTKTAPEPRGTDRPGTVKPRGWRAPTSSKEGSGLKTAPAPDAAAAASEAAPATAAPAQAGEAAPAPAGEPAVKTAPAAPATGSKARPGTARPRVRRPGTPAKDGSTTPAAPAGAPDTGSKQPPATAPATGTAPAADPKAP